MPNFRLPYKLLILINVAAGLVWLTTPVHGQSIEIVSPTQANIDLTILQQDNSYSLPTSIVITPLTVPQLPTNISSRDWVRGLYYYTVANANRPGFTDIPFHYLITSDGEIYQGNQGGDERKINIEGQGDAAIVIAYLTSSRQISFDQRVEEPLSQLLLQLANKNAVPFDRVRVIGTKLQRNDTEKNIKLVKTDLLGVWNTSLTGIVNKVKAQYKPQPKQYKLEVVGVELPAEQVTPGQTVTGKLKVKNSGQFGIYSGTGNELLGTTLARQSQFYVRGTWVTTTQFDLMPADAVLMPGQEASYEFKLYVPLFFGQRQEDFEVRTVNGGTIANSRFKVTLNVKRPTGTIVQVKPTNTGWLRVRSTPSGVQNNEIGRVYAGERYFQIQDAGNGYVKIRLPDGKEGWVSKQYLTYI
jgi:hypothetical protein